MGREFERITSSDNFTNTVDTAKLTKAVYIAVTAAGTAATLTNPLDSTSVDFVTGGTFLPISVNAAITGIGLTIIYCY